VTLQEVVELQGKRHALFPWVPGVTLRDLLEALSLAGRPASIGLVGRVLIDAARSLGAAQSSRPHGGLSDASLQLGFDGVVSVLDWGAPRVSRFRPLGRVNFAADVFALGAVLHAALTGHAGDYTPLPSTLPQPSTTHAEATTAIDAVVLKAIAVQADDRHAGVAALADELEAVLGEQVATTQQLGDEVRSLFRDRIKLLQSLGGLIEPAKEDLEAELPGAVRPFIPTGTQAYGANPLVRSGPRPGIPLGTQPYGSNPMLPVVKELTNEPLPEIGEHERTQVRIPVPPEKPMVPWESSPELPAVGVADEGTQPGVFAPTSRDEAPRRASGSHAIPQDDGPKPRASAPRPSRPSLAELATKTTPGGSEVEESKTGPQPVLVEEASKTGPSEVHEPALGDDDGLAATGVRAAFTPPDEDDGLAATGAHAVLVPDGNSPSGVRGDTTSPGIAADVVLPPSGRGDSTSPGIAGSALSPAGVRGDTTSPGIAADAVLSSAARGDSTSPGLGADARAALTDDGAPTSAGGPDAKPVLTGSRNAFKPGDGAAPAVTGSRGAFKPADGPSSTSSERPGLTGSRGAFKPAEAGPTPSVTGSRSALKPDAARVTGSRAAIPEGRRPTGLDALSVEAVRMTGSRAALSTEPPTNLVDVPDDTQPRAKLRPSGVPPAQQDGATNPRIPLPPERTDPIGVPHEDTNPSARAPRDDTNPEARAPIGDPETVEPTRPRAPRPSSPRHATDDLEDSDTAPRPRNTTEEERARARGQERVATPPRGIEVMGEEFADLNEPTAVRKRIVEPVEEEAELNEPTAVRKRIVEPVEEEEDEGILNEPTAVRTRPEAVQGSSGTALRVVMVGLLVVVVGIAIAVVMKLKAQAEAEPVPELVEEIDAGLAEVPDAGVAAVVPLVDDVEDAGEEEEEDDDAGVDEEDAGVDAPDAGTVDAGTPDAGKAVVKKAPPKKTVKKKKRRR
jgi:hypothetical protein